MAWAGVEARRWRCDYLAFFLSLLRPIEAYENHPGAEKSG
jgi:hypothetical protein